MKTERLPENYVPTITNEDLLESSDLEDFGKDNGAPENILETIESEIQNENQDRGVRRSQHAIIPPILMQ